MPRIRSESCTFIWHPKVVTWKRLTRSGYRAPNLALFAVGDFLDDVRGDVFDFFFGQACRRRQACRHRRW